MQELNELVVENAWLAHLMFKDNQDSLSENKSWIERKLQMYEGVGEIPGIKLEERTWRKLLMNYGVTSFEKFAELPEEKKEEEIKEETKSAVPYIFKKKVPKQDLKMITSNEEEIK